MRGPLFILLSLMATSPAFAQGEGHAFFESKIRPVLVEHCYSCHSAEAKKQRGGLRLDTRDAVLSGGDTGPAIDPKAPAKSLLLHALRYDGELKMPPKGKLPAAVIADFETWIAMGAPDPRTGAVKTATKSPSVEEGRKFWAYKPVVAAPAPKVKNTKWPASEIDAFILAAIEAKSLTPAPDAEPRTLLRRLHFDLVGLPPTPKQLDDFAADAARDYPLAIVKAVDALLESPHFGERWGRHWLDVARYADSLTLRGFVLPDAWRYRDFVIDAFNRDLPFDQFVREQLAGDLMKAEDPTERRRQLAGAGFLAIGNNNLEEQDKKLLRMDVVDEQLETMGRAFLGQTIGCARCHDHKFDPIPTRDYYALAGILRSTKTIDTRSNVAKWLETNLPVMPEDRDRLEKHEAAVAELVKSVDAIKATIPKIDTKGPVTVKSLPGIVIDDADAMKVGSWKDSTSSPRYIGAGYVHDDAKLQGEKTLTFEAKLPRSGKYEVRFAYSTGGNRASDVPVTVFSEDGEKTIVVDETKSPPIDGLFISLGQFRFEKSGQSYVVVSNMVTKGHVIADAVAFIPLDEAAAPVKGEAAKGEVPKADVARLKLLEDQLKKMRDEGPKRDKVLGVEDESPANLKIHIRGSVSNLGAEAPRGVLQVASIGPMPAIPRGESGRRQLADWVASADNPLTARVAVNRVWHWLMGDGIVRTVDNFGATGETPSNADLLDHLADRFVKDGWSMKKLIKEIVLSRTYRQASRPADAKTLAADPENRLFAHANRRRLDAECLRDAMLSVSGQLDLSRGGPTFKNVSADYNYKHTDVRRSVYSPIFRNSLPEIFEVFDFADPSVSTGRRSTTTVAPQALFLMNNPFVIQQSQAAAKRLLGSDGDRIGRAYQMTLGRSPTPAERRIAEEFLASDDAAWPRFVQALFASIDFRFVE